MKTEHENEKLTALPTQLIELREGVLLKRGAVELLVRGDRAASVIAAILNETAARALSRDAICERFAGIDRPAVRILVKKLVDRRILIPTENSAQPAGVSDESEFEIFCWSFGTSEAVVRDKLQTRRIAVLGVNAIARRFVHSLRECGIEHVELVDFPLLRNLRFFDNDEIKSSEWPHPPPLNYELWTQTLDPKRPICLVPTSDFGGMVTLRRWNDLCVANGFHLFPIVLQDLVGYIGPFVVPGETPCYECLRARQNAHLAAPDVARAAEGAAFEGQRSVGYHPAMASILADIAAMELTKFYSEALPFAQPGKLIEVNLMRPQLEVHNVLRLPRCMVCSPLRWRSSTSPTKSTFVGPDPVNT